MAIFNDNLLIVKEEYTEIYDRFKTTFTSEYTDLSFEPQSFESILVEFLTQLTLDQQDFIVSLINQLDLTTATGQWLDVIGYIRGILRKKGVYTIQQIDVVATGAVNLYGTDQDNETIFKVSDTDGQEYILLNTISITSAGTYSLTFRSNKMDKIQSSINTINNIVTQKENILSVNNSVSEISIGSILEEDAPYRSRIIDSRFNLSNGLAQSLISALRSSDTVNNAKYIANNSNISFYGLEPGQSMVIVDGGTDDEILQAFSNNVLSANLSGSQEVLYVDNYTSYSFNYERVNSVNFYTNISITLFSGSSLDETVVKNYVVDNFIKFIGARVSIQDILKPLSTYLEETKIDSFISNVEVSLDNITYSTYISPLNIYDSLSPSFDNITITIATVI